MPAFGCSNGHSARLFMHVMPDIGNQDAFEGSGKVEIGTAAGENSAVSAARGGRQRAANRCPEQRLATVRIPRGGLGQYLRPEDVICVVGSCMGLLHVC